MMTAWLVASLLMGIAGMFGELRKGSSVLVATAGFVCSFVLWPVLVLWMILLTVIMCVYMACMKFF